MENIASVSNQIPGGSNKDIGITFLYDTYVVYGVAAAQVGLNYIQCYTDWLNGALNYESFTKDGSWGHIHEYNHHFQDYIKLDGEATNNAISLIEYYLFTNVSQNRTETSPVSGDWNIFADPYRSLSITKENQTKGELHDELNEYADILYSFGYETFVNAAKKCSRVDNYDQWFKALCDESKYDMTYYFTKIINKTLSSEALEYAKSLNYPTFIPVASLYQTGRVNHNVNNMSVLPFIVNSNSYTLDLNKYLVVPNGFTYQINSFTGDSNVTINKDSNNIYTVSFSGDQTNDLLLDVTVSGDGIESNIKLILGLSKKYRDLSTVTSPYALDTNTSNVIDAKNTKIVEYSPYLYNYNEYTSNEECLNNGDDVDCLFSHNWELNVHPYEITMDMNEVALVNKLTICQGFTSSQNGPSKFKLYGGENKDNMSLLGEYETTYTNNYTSVFFNPTSIRYFKLEITAVGNSHETYYGDVTLSRLEMSLDFGKGYRLSPFDESILVKNRVSKEINVEATYGYLLKCENSSISFKFKGQKLVLFFKDYSNSSIIVDNSEYQITNNVAIIDVEDANHSVIITGTYSLDSMVIIQN